MSNISKRRKEGSKAKFKSMGDHQEFLRRISKTLYYGQLPTLPCLSLPVTEISCEVWSMAQRGRSVRRLYADQAANIAHSACVSPCALVLAILYLERLKRCNPDYLNTTSPSDLFLVSLMVSNKFLQDDGEDDEVICSEWAASGGVDLSQLNKLEADFLTAIDWNIFINEKSFEKGLSWLERQVALKQARLRGFFTYTDLALTCDTALFGELVKSLSSACFALTLSYVTSFMTLFASTLFISNVWLPALEHVIARGSGISVIDPRAFTTTAQEPDLTNITIHLPDEYILQDSYLNLKCCEKWQRYQDNADVKKTWNDGVTINDLKLLQSWWSKTSILNWLYQSSLINPMQRWLEKINGYADLINRTKDHSASKYQCNNAFKKVSEKQHCLQQQLNLGKLSIFATSVSDR